MTDLDFSINYFTKCIIKDFECFSGFLRSTISTNIKKTKLEYAGEYLDIKNDRFFYKYSKWLIYDLLTWNESPYFKEWVKLSYLNAKGKILDYGAGIGTLSLIFGKCGKKAAYCDLNLLCKDFSYWRHKKYNIPFQIDTIKNKYNTIIILEVAEHFPSPNKFIEEIEKKLMPYGRLIIKPTYGKTRIHPMHYDWPYKISFKTFFKKGDIQ
jgi:2-polyprenyl-3-methyl-5-hydroxy-6-metoxy-1,4-benzoquinol methylase